MTSRNTQEAPGRPFPSLTRGVPAIKSLYRPQPPVSRVFHILIRAANHLLLGAVRVPLLILTSTRKEQEGLQNDMLLTTACLHAATCAASLAHHLRTLTNTEATQVESMYLTRQAEAAKMQLSIWTDITGLTSAFGALLVILQVVAFSLCFLTFSVLPSCGYITVGFIAEVAKRRYAYLVLRLRRLSSWSAESPPPSAAHFWALQENATLEDLFEAMQQDVEYMKLVNAAVVRSELHQDLASLLAPAAQPAIGMLTPAPQTPPTGMLENPLYHDLPSVPSISSSSQRELQNWKISSTTVFPNQRRRSSPLHRRSVSSSGNGNGTPASGSTTPHRSPDAHQSAGRSRAAGSAYSKRLLWRRSVSPASHDVPCHELTSMNGSQLDDDSASMSGSVISNRSKSEAREPHDVLAVMDEMWASHIA